MNLRAPIFDEKKGAKAVFLGTFFLQIVVVFIAYFLPETSVERLDQILHFGNWAWPSVASMAELYGDAGRNRAQLIILASLATPVFMTAVLTLVYRHRVLQNRSFLSWHLVKNASIGMAMVAFLFFVLPGAYTGVGIRTKISLTNTFVMLPFTAICGYGAGMMSAPFIVALIATILRPFSRKRSHYIE